MAMERIDDLAKLAPRIPSASAPTSACATRPAYPALVRAQASASGVAFKFVGIPELHREEIRATSYATGAGCNATVTILGLRPCMSAGW